MERLPTSGRNRALAVTTIILSTLHAEDFRLNHLGAEPITLHTTLTYDGVGERLIATAKNESGVEIRFARICIIAAAMQKECLFRLWNTELWPPGAVLNWNVLTTQRVASLTQSASLVDFEIATAPEAQPSVSASPPAPSAPAQPIALPTPTNHKSGKLQFPVTIIDRQDSNTRYSYVVPGFSNSNSSGDVNCIGGANSVNCSGSTRTTTSTAPPRAISYEVRGATLSL
jgi:hypothetical protein